MDGELPRRAIAAFERACGLAVCLHSIEPALLRSLPPERRRYHHHPACRAAKASRTRACQAFCGDLVLRAAATAAGFLTTRCHAGHTELVAALRDRNGVPRGVLFAGVARPAGDLAPVLADRSPLPALATAGRLPPLGVDDAAWKGELLVQLALRLGAWLDRLHAPTPSAAAREPEDRAGLILGWAARHASEPGAFARLANRLGLSTDRARHVVAEVCGRPWRRLRSEARLQTAADLLDASDLPVAHIARQAGFSDHARFSASFRRWSGCTPSAWRQRAR